jgi:hypothetical protein
MNTAVPSIATNSSAMSAVSISGNMTNIHAVWPTAPMSSTGRRP